MITSSLTRPLTSRLTRAIAEAGVGGGWASSLPALRSFVTANYDQPNPHNQAVMASPPTVTATGTTRPVETTVSSTLTPATVETAGMRLLGGTMFFAGGVPRFYSADLGATGGNGGLNDGKECSAWRVDIQTSSPIVAFLVYRTTVAYRVLVDDEYVGLTGTTTVGTTGSTAEYIKIDFGSAASRRITLEGQQACGTNQVWVETGYTVVRPAGTPKRIAFAGDSFTYGTGATALGDGYGWVTADALGFAHSLNSGSGGTGYVATSGASVKLADRLADINATGPHDVIVVAMGVNDIAQSASAASVTAQVAACLASLRASNPAAQIFVAGPWDVAAPSAPAAAYSTIKAAIQAGIGSGATFLDPQGVEYAKADATHPNTAGHKTLGDWLALQIKTAMGA